MALQCLAVNEQKSPGCDLSSQKNLHFTPSYDCPAPK